MTGQKIIDGLRDLVGREQRHATLPMGNGDAENSLAAMEIGEVRWTTPWAMYADPSRHLWLNGNYPANLSPGGTVCMKVSRDEQGWHVDATRCAPSEKWSTKSSPWGALIRVVTFKR